jgi:DNA-binding response OmpR family regulator
MDRQWFLAGNEIPPKTKQKQRFVTINPLPVRQGGVGRGTWPPGFAMQTNDPPRFLRFGIFEVDLQAGRLTKHGLRLKLQEQPFQVLAMLLEKPGELVNREELQSRLWPRTIVDFDHGLNKAINKIRDVLRDSAENPRFIETVARRGIGFSPTS